MKELGAASVRKLVEENHQYSYQKVWVSTTGIFIPQQVCRIYIPEFLFLVVWSYLLYLYTYNLYIACCILLQPQLSTHDELQRIRSGTVLTCKKSAPVKTLIDRIADQKVSAESQSLIDKNNSPNSGSGGFYLYGRDRRAKSHYYGMYILSIMNLLQLQYFYPIRMIWSYPFNYNKKITRLCLYFYFLAGSHYVCKFMTGC